MNAQWTTYAIQCDLCPNTSWCKDMEKLRAQLAQEGWEFVPYANSGLSEHYCPSCRGKR